MRFNNYLTEVRMPKPSTKCDYRVVTFISFNSPDEKDITNLYTLSDKTNKRFVLTADNSVFYWEYSGDKQDKDVFSCNYVLDEKLEKPHDNKKEYLAGILDGKYVVMDSNNKVFISERSFDKLMSEIVEKWDRYPIYEWPDRDSKEGYDAYSKYNEDWYERTSISY